MNFDSPNARLWQSRILSVLRVVAALVLMQHGSQKMFNFPAPGGATGPAAPYVLMSLTGIAGILETFGGFAILIGLFTRPIAFILCGEMAVAYFLFHNPRAFMPILNRGEVPVLLCFIFLYLVFAGAGVWSVDALISASQRQRGAPGNGSST
jgi:putative oxidoreductase